jgi:RNA polymerase subunit RPABC4/transcription elongation factor Spt4
MKNKECPSCAMNVDANAKECPICGYEFADFSPGFKWVAFLLIAVFILYLFL